MSENEQSKLKNTAGKHMVNAGATIGGTTAGAAAGVAAGAGAANIAAAAASGHLASLAVGPFSGFAAYLSGTTAPAWWAVIAVNPLTAPIAAAGGAALGAYAAYKIARKILK